MHSDAQFHTTYLALIALTWEALERVDQRLDARDDVQTMAELQPKLQLLRLELLLLGAKSGCLAGSRALSMNQNVLVQRLVSKLLGWLDFDSTATTGVARMRIQSAQNWLFAEADQDQWAELPLHKDEGRRVWHDALVFNQQLLRP